MLNRTLRAGLLALVALAATAPASPQEAAGPQLALHRSYWHLVTSMPTAPGATLDLWVNLATLDLGLSQTEYVPALELVEPGAEPDYPKLRTKWESPPGVEHEVETPRKPNEDADTWAKRHADYVTAAFKHFPPAPPPPPGGG